MEEGNHSLLHLSQAPASVQSRTHEPRQDRKVATVVRFRCAAAVTGACPVLTDGQSYSEFPPDSCSDFSLAQRAVADSFNLLRVSGLTIRFFLAGVASATAAD